VGTKAVVFIVGNNTLANLNVFTPFVSLCNPFIASQTSKGTDCNLECKLTYVASPMVWQLPEDHWGRSKQMQNTLWIRVEKLID
jgi:hypothetical protein